MALGLLGSTQWACGPQAVTPRRVPHVGFFSLDTTASAPLVEEFRAGLRDFGYDDGTTVRVLWRRGDEQPNDAILGEFIKMPVDVIVANGGGAQLDAKRATKTIPIVIVTGNDPVEAGIVESLARPGGNITGIGGRPTIGKRLELLQQIAPGISKVAVLTADGPTGKEQLKAAQDAARQLGVEILPVEVTHMSQAWDALASALQRGANGLLVQPIVGEDKRAEIAFAAAHRLPAAYWSVTYTDLGGLLVFADNLLVVFHRVGNYVGRILNGADPAELPIEPPQNSHLTVNLRTARALGLTVPPSVLNIATRVVE